MDNQHFRSTVYIRKEILELANLSQSEGLEFLAFLLNMAALEAEKAAHSDRPATKDVHAAWQ